MKTLRRHIALCVLPLFLFVFLSGCESGRQDSGWDKEAYDKNSEISTQLLITYLDNHNREYPEGVASIDFDWQGNLVFFIEPDYDGLEEAIREEMGDAVFSIEYYKFTPRYLYTAKAKVEQYLASFPEGENPLKTGEPRVEATGYLNRVILPVQDLWSEEKDKTLREAIGPQSDAIFILYFGTGEYLDSSSNS